MIPFSKIISMEMPFKKILFVILIVYFRSTDCGSYKDILMKQKFGIQNNWPIFTHEDLHIWWFWISCQNLLNFFNWMHNIDKMMEWCLQQQNQYVHNKLHFIVKRFGNIFHVRWNLIRFLSSWFFIDPRKPL